MEVKEIIVQHEEKMDKTIEALKRELSSIRTGRASTSLLDRITVDYYGTPTPVKQVANVSVPEPRMITIAPWEPKMLGEIEKAILKSDLGLNPNNDGKIIRLEIPQLTEERRKELSKKVSKIAEDSKVVIRNIRRDANETIKKMEKKKEVTEDDSKEGQENIQKLTDKKSRPSTKSKRKKKKKSWPYDGYTDFYWHAVTVCQICITGKKYSLCHRADCVAEPFLPLRPSADLCHPCPGKGRRHGLPVSR